MGRTRRRERRRVLEEGTRAETHVRRGIEGSWEEERWGRECVRGLHKNPKKRGTRLKARRIDLILSRDLCYAIVFHLRSSKLGLLYARVREDA